VRDLERRGWPPVAYGTNCGADRAELGMLVVLVIANGAHVQLHFDAIKCEAVPPILRNPSPRAVGSRVARRILW
jgi:hypothetical protein